MTTLEHCAAAKGTVPFSASPTETTDEDRDSPRVSSLFLATILAVIVSVPAHETAMAQTAAAETTAAADESSSRAAKWDLIAVSEDEPWMMAVAAPVAGQGRAKGRMPLVLALSEPPTREAEDLIAQAAPKHFLLWTDGAEPKLGRRLPKLGPQMLAVGSDSVRGSLLVAKRFWKRPAKAVVAASDDPEAIILGSALAARMAAPLLIRERAESRTSLQHVLEELGVTKILAAVADVDRAPGWAKSKKYEVEMVAPRAMQDRLIDLLGPEDIHTLVVARAPEKRTTVGPTAWLAPYIGLVRGAPVVLAHSANAAVAEADVARLIKAHQLQPRTMTILADYDSLGDNFVDIEGEAEPAAAAATGKYQLNTEPFVPTEAGRLAAFGVGRIPLQSLEDAAVLFVRGLLRERLTARQAVRLLMVANSSPGRRPLPLCETISRLTAEEYKNCGVPVDGFYGKLADSPEVLAAAKTAGLIIYEGHLAYQDLFDVPSAHRETAPDSYFEEELDNLEEGTSHAPTHAARTTPLVSTRRRPAAAKTNQLSGSMEGLPVVVLQSCDSLDERVLWRVDELGGVALVGSVTPIHSGSGSAMVKAFSDAMLYRGATLGEALRDAQNYLFCLGDLKVRRGQKEQAKSRRVALSFRLWGDPELQVLPASQMAPQYAPLAVRWTAPNRLIIDVPEHRLPAARSDKYFARMFPGSQPAGMVKQTEGDTARRVTPVYFFRMVLPDDFSTAAATLISPGGQTNQAIFRVDPTKRFLYVVFYPDMERAGESIVLRQGAAVAPQRLGRARW
jgi:hypothetical protein